MLTHSVRGIVIASQEMSMQLVEILEQHKIHPVIGEVFEWTEARAAFEALLARSMTGKVVISV